MVLAFAMMAGLMFLLLKDRKNNQTLPPANPIPTGGANELLLDSEESAIDYVRNQLSSMGASQEDIDDYIDWLVERPRSEADIRKRIERIT